MTCSYCQASNSENDHRCRRCGRRLAGSAVSAPDDYASQAVGATALKVERNAFGSETAELERASTSKTAERTRRPAQTSLFAEEFASRVIPFDARQRDSLLQTARAKRPTDAVLNETSEMDSARKTALKVPRRKMVAGPAGSRGEQSTLDFLPSSQIQAARTLKTTVEAVIYCDAPVASPLHRAMAALLDGSMICLGLGVFLAIFEIFGGPFTWSKENIMVWIGVVALIAMFYSFLWALCGLETAGMTWTELRIINFNGFAPDGKSRALRLIGCWLSYCSGTIGIFWALMDEEGLTWHDHMSKTFPTVRENHTTLVRQRR